MFFGLILGVLLVGSYLTASATKTILLAGVIIVLLLMLLASVILLNKLEFAHYYTKVLGIIVLSITLGISLTCAVAGYKMHVQSEYSKKYGTSSVSIHASGRIYSVKIMENSTTFVLDSVLINDESLGCKVSFTNTSESLDLSVGDHVSFNATIQLSQVYSYALNSRLISQNIFFTGYVSDNIIVGENTQNFIERIQTKTETTLKLYAGENYGILKALLLGNKDDVDTDIYSIFTNSGVVHILSVSGLHVNFVVMLIALFLDKLKVKNKTQFVVCFLFLALYSTICGLASSVIRASIMSLCLMLAKLTNRKQDGLSSLGLAGSILLMINPIYVYNIGFQLSFLSMFGIILLSRPFQLMLQRLRIVKYVSASLAVTFSATLATLPVVAKSFGGIATLSLVANFLLVPVFSIYFCVLFIVFLINIFLPLGVLYVPLAKFFDLFIAMCSYLASFGNIKLSALHPFVILIYYIILFTISKFSLMANSRKIFVCMVGLVLIVCNMLVPAKSNYILQLRDFDGTYLYRSNGQNYLVLDSITRYDAFVLKQSLYAQNIWKIENIILTYYADSMDSVLQILLDAFDFDIVYFDSIYSTEQVHHSTNISPNKLKSVSFDYGFSLNSGEYFYGVKNSSSELIGFCLLNGNYSLLYANSNFSASDVDYLVQPTFTYVFVDTLNQDMFSALINLRGAKICYKNLDYNQAKRSMITYYQKIDF